MKLWKNKQTWNQNDARTCMMSAWEFQEANLLGDAQQVKLIPNPLTFACNTDLYHINVWLSTTASPPLKPSRPFIKHMARTECPCTVAGGFPRAKEHKHPQNVFIYWRLIAQSASRTGSPRGFHPQNKFLNLIDGSRQYLSLRYMITNNMMNMTQLLQQNTTLNTAVFVCLIA